MTKNPFITFLVAIVAILLLTVGIIYPEFAMQYTAKINSERNKQLTTEKNELQAMLDGSIQNTLNQNNLQIEDITDFSVLLCNYKIIYLGRTSGQNQYSLTNAGLEEGTSTSICPRQIEALTKYYSQEAYVIEGNYYSRKNNSANFEKAQTTDIDLFRPDAYLLRYLAYPQIETFTVSEDKIIATISSEQDNKLTKLTFKYSEIIQGHITEFIYQVITDNSSNWRGVVKISPYQDAIVLPEATKHPINSNFNNAKINKLIDADKSAIHVYNDKFIINKMLFKDELSVTTYGNETMLASCPFREEACSLSVDTLELKIRQLLQKNTMASSVTCPPAMPISSSGINVIGPLNETYRNQLGIRIDDESNVVKLSTDYSLEIIYDIESETVFINENEEPAKCYQRTVSQDQIQRDIDSFLKYSNDFFLDYSPTIFTQSLPSSPAQN